MCCPCGSCFYFTACGLGPTYLRDCLLPKYFITNLRVSQQQSAASTIHVPSSLSQNMWEVVLVITHQFWNFLPLEVCQSPSLIIFCNQCKTFFIWGRILVCVVKLWGILWGITLLLFYYFICFCGSVIVSQPEPFWGGWHIK